MEFAATSASSLVSHKDGNYLRNYLLSHPNLFLPLSPLLSLLSFRDLFAWYNGPSRSYSSPSLGRISFEVYSYALIAGLESSFPTIWDMANIIPSDSEAQQHFVQTHSVVSTSFANDVPDGTPDRN
ncbi:uncharacterized protein L203_100260 [Cryptococcus depauperatus CBS 7841]|uniref:Uncharacterized protein n=1 Tax=Cryptococcus depauperatus CBS 7841 TaxID=1295531 RepID=A0A1E3IZ57_9TREE|nr:hypothetical protein L203_00081 [Cryptococcus depauperatus CBS 7841]